jgi:hypothetical protein
MVVTEGIAYASEIQHVSLTESPMSRTLSTLAALSLLVAGGCNKDSTPIVTTSEDGASLSAPADSVQARGNSLVRVVNAVAGGKTVQAMVADRTLFSEVQPGAVSDYSEVPANMATFSVRVLGATTMYTFPSNDQMLTGGSRYTIFLIAEDVSSAVLRIVKDDLTPGSGKARIRVMHAAPGGPEFDVIATNGTAKLFTGISFKSEAGFIDVEPSTVDLEFRAKGGSKVLLRIPAVELAPGTATTIVVTGASALQFIKFTDLMLAETPNAK